jgi:hypothetical protein
MSTKVDGRGKGDGSVKRPSWARGKKGDLADLENIKKALESIRFEMGKGVDVDPATIEQLEAGIARLEEIYGSDGHHAE